MMNTKLFGVLAVALMLAVALTPMASVSLDATDGEESDYSSLNEDAMTIAMQIVEDLPDDFTEEDVTRAVQEYGAEYGDAVITAVVISLVFLAGFFVGYVAGSSTSAPSGDSSIVAYEQEVLAQKMSSHMSAVMRMAVKLLPNDSNMLKFTSAYWERAVEFTIASPNMWSKGATMNAEAVLKSAGVRESICNYIHTWQRAISNEIIGVSQEQSVNISQYDCYQGMSVSFDWISGSIIQSNPSSSTWAYGDLKTAVYTTNTTSTVYLDTPTESDATDVDESFANRVYLYSPNGTTATMTSLSNGSTYTLNPGWNKITSAGLYRLNTSGVIYAGDFTTSSDSNAADLLSCLVMSDGDSSFAYALYNAASDSVKIYKSGGAITVSVLNYSVSYKDANGSGQSEDIDLLDMIKTYQKMINAQAYVIEECVKDADATWRIFDACEASSSYVHPSTVMTVLKDSSLTTDNLIVNYYNAMKQLSLYYEQYGEQISDIEIEADSSATDVLIYGDIYCNGNLVVEGAIMTPSVYVSSETYKVCESHLVQQQTICTVWKQGAESIEEYVKYTGSVGGVPVATLDAGCVIEVQSIKYKGSQVSEYTLEVPEIIYIPDPIPEPTPSPEPIDYVDSDVLVIIIMIELAIIFFLLCFILGNPVAGLIIATIVIVVGVLFAGTISSLMLGTFEWPWWWPF